MPGGKLKEVSHSGLLVAALMFGTAASEVLCSQESIFDTDHVYARITFAANGNPLVTVSKTGGLYVDKRLSLIEHETILDEIDANKDQRKELRGLIGWRDKSRKSILATWDFGNRKEALAKMKVARAESDKRLREILLGHQVEMVESIQQRIHLRRIGVLKFLTEGKLAEQLKLKKHQLKKIEGNVKELGQEWKRKQDKFAKQLVAKLEEVLDESQKKKLRAEFDTATKDAHSEIHTIQLELVANSKNRPSKSRSTEYLRAVTDISQYVVQNDGSWKQEKVYEILSEGSAAYRIMSSIRTKGYFSKAIVSEAKTAEIAKVQSSIQDELRHLSVIRQKQQKAGIDSDIIWKNERKLALKVFGRAKDWIDENLDDKQKEFITKELRLQSMKCNGLLYELTEKTGKKLGLDKKQKEAIVAIAKQEYEELVADSIRFESRVFSEIHKALSRNQSKLLSPITKWRPEKLCPSVTLLLLDNREGLRTIFNLETRELQSY